MERSQSLNLLSPETLASWAKWLLLAGLALVTLSQLAPALPVLTGLGLLMLGATQLTAERLAPHQRPLLLGLHLMIYLLLYAFFLSAVIGQGTAGLAVTPAWLRLTDIATSAFLVVTSLKLGLRSIE